MKNRKSNFSARFASIKDKKSDTERLQHHKDDFFLCLKFFFLLLFFSIRLINGVLREKNKEKKRSIVEDFHVIFLSRWLVCMSRDPRWMVKV